MQQSKIEKMDGADCANQGSATESWTYTYDGDGVRVEEVYTVSGVDQYTKHFFIGGAYEVEINHIPEPDAVLTKKYYAIAGMRVAMDNGTDLVYFASDHLSSTSIAISDTGTLLSEQRYKPFGELRTDVGTILNPGEAGFTDFGYTGQRNLGDVGLMDYNARFYSPLLGRFIQPDSIVPNPGDPQSLNRFSYVRNNPISFIDPTGHLPTGENGERCLPNSDCWSIPPDDEVLHTLIYHNKRGANNIRAIKDILAKYDITFSGDWSTTDRELAIVAAAEGILGVGSRFLDYSNVSGISGNSALSAFQQIFGEIVFLWGTSFPPGDPNARSMTKECVGISTGACTSSAHMINFVTTWGQPPGRSWDDMFIMMRNHFVHELGHAFASIMYNDPRGPYKLVPNDLITDGGFYSDTRMWNQRGETTGNEIFADMFLGWTFNKFGNDLEGLGSDRQIWMMAYMGGWINQLTTP